MATRFKGSEERSAMLMTYVCSKKIATEPQITGGCMEVWEGRYEEVWMYVRRCVRCEEV